MKMRKYNLDVECTSTQMIVLVQRAEQIGIHIEDWKVI